MKKYILLVTAFAAQMNFAQNTFPTTGNVGIGTTAPSAKLETINTIAGITSFKSMGTNGYLLIDNVGSGENYYSANKFQEFQINGIPKMRINLEGNVGIGTSTPLHKLDVNGHAIVRGAIISSMSDDGGGQIQLKNPSKITNGTASTWMMYNMTGGYGNSLQFWAYDNLGCGTGLCNNRFTIMDSGNVGIGTTNPVNKLDVNGTIHSKEVKVDMLGWSDYVFKKEYNLPTLEEVEKHINEKGHLENIPSEEEVLKNGINLGEMNAKLLQKMEEMTLYMIEMKKDIAILKEENKVLKAKK
jgi:hypothetical protein